jgi:hypothetical protein
MGSSEHQAHRVLDRIELRFGIDEELRSRLLPSVQQILDLDPQGEERGRMLRMIAEAYAYQVKGRGIARRLETTLRRRVTDCYADILGIEPPNLDP